MATESLSNCLVAMVDTQPAQSLEVASSAVEDAGGGLIHTVQRRLGRHRLSGCYPHPLGGMASGRYTNPLVGVASSSYTNPLVGVASSSYTNPLGGMASEEETDFSFSEEEEGGVACPSPRQAAPHHYALSLHHVRSGVVNCSPAPTPAPAAPHRVRASPAGTTTSEASPLRGRSGVVNCPSPSSSSSQHPRSGVVNCQAPSSFAPPKRIRSGVLNCTAAEVPASHLGTSGRHVSVAHSDLHGSSLPEQSLDHRPKMSVPPLFSPSPFLMDVCQARDDSEREAEAASVSGLEGPGGRAGEEGACAGRSPSPVISRSPSPVISRSPSPVVSCHSSTGDTEEPIKVDRRTADYVHGEMSAGPPGMAQDTALGMAGQSFHVRRLTPVVTFAALRELRKFSEPVTSVRRELVQRSRPGRKPRCLSDSAAPDFYRVLRAGVEDFELHSEEGGSSAHGYDSGYHDDIRSKAPDSVWSAVLSESDGGHEPPPLAQRKRRITPFPGTKEPDAPLNTPPTPVDTPISAVLHARRSLTRSSIGGASSFDASESESHSLSSLWDYQSRETVTEILSSLGFDDYEAPGLVPDRFIPKDLEHLRPSVMRSQAASPAPPVVMGPAKPPPTLMDLPLGATAENFLSQSSRPLSPPPETPLPSSPPPESSPETTPLYAESTDIAQLVRSRAVLEPVPEETASDLSPSPRWFSPRVSFDHSVDLAGGQLGTSLVQKARKRSLPQREGYRLSLGSQVESEPDSILLSVTSYDDELAREKEREKEELSVPIALPSEDFAQRRRRRGVYTPPPNLMNWLSTQQPISEEDWQDLDPDELPWPFNEEVRLRKSLTEIRQARESSCAEPTGAEPTGTEPTGTEDTHASCSLSECDSQSSPESVPSPSSPRHAPSPPLRQSPSPLSLEVPPELAQHLGTTDHPAMQTGREEAAARLVSRQPSSLRVNSNVSNSNRDKKYSEPGPFSNLCTLSPRRQALSHETLRRSSEPTLGSEAQQQLQVALATAGAHLNQTMERQHHLKTLTEVATLS